MNILILTYQGYEGTGSTFSIAYLAKGLTERGHQILVGCPESSYLFGILKDTNVRLIPMEFRSKIDRNNIRLIARTVRGNNIQIINAQSGIDRYTSIFAKWFYRLDVKIVHTRRQTPRSFGGFIQNRFYISGTEKIVVNSSQLKSTFMKKGIPENHLHVIYNGLPKENFKLIREDIVQTLREKFNIKKGDVVVGCVSRKKKQYQLLQALKNIDSSVKVIFAGIPPGTLDENIEEEKVQQEIIYAGILDKVEIMNLYKLFDVMVLPSTTEGFGLVLVEAMGAGTPVIGTRAEGIIDVLDNEKNGLWFDDENIDELAEKINLVLYDKDLRNRLIQNGKKAAFERFSIENTILNYEIFFQSLL